MGVIPQVENIYSYWLGGNIVCSIDETPRFRDEKYRMKNNAKQLSYVFIDRINVYVRMCSTTYK